MTADLLDETYDRMARTGPEFQGWLSNHGPMAVDALIRLGQQSQVEPWLASYVDRLDGAPEPRWPISEDEWREVIGDPSRLGDWCQLFQRQVQEQPWQDVLMRWWPRLLPGAVASAGHGLIRTGHALRALREQDSPLRRRELAIALGYWAARWALLPPHPDAAGTRTLNQSLDDIPIINSAGGIRTRLTELGQSPRWPSTVAGLQPVVRADDVPAALDALVDEAIVRYGRWGHASPVLLVHAATAPRAAALALWCLPKQLWTVTWQGAWAVSAAICAVYRPSEPAPVLERGAITRADVAERAAGTGDEHAIKFAEVALESDARGNAEALEAAKRAIALIGQE